MTARKTRPELGAPVTEDMSQRDMAAAIGISTGELNRWKRLSQVPEDQFEAALKRGERKAETIIKSAKGEPVTVPGRVRRAKGIYLAMTPEEQAAFKSWLLGRLTT